MVTGFDAMQTAFFRELISCIWSVARPHAPRPLVQLEVTSRCVGQQWLLGSVQCRLLLFLLQLYLFPFLLQPLSCLVLLFLGSRLACINFTNSQMRSCDVCV